MVYIYQYNENIAFFKVKTFPYKGVKYKYEDCHVIVDGKEYLISRVEKNKLNEYDIWLWKSMEDFTSIKGNRDIIDSRIEHVIIIKSQEQINNVVYDNPDAISMGSGCIWYVIIMVGGLIFKDWFLIWVFASIVFWPWFFNKPRFKK